MTLPPAEAAAYAAVDKHPPERVGYTVEQVEETYLKQLARARGLLKYAKFLESYRRTGVGLGLRNPDVTTRQYRRWLAGDVKTAPNPDACRILHDMFNCQVEDLFRLVPVTAPTPVGADEVIDLSPAAGAIWSTYEPPPAARTLHELMMSAAEQSRQSAAQAEAAIGRSTLELLEADVVRTARTYLSQSPVVMFPKVNALRTQVETLTGQTRQPEQVRTLTFLNGLLCALLAEASIDLGEHRWAHDHATAAWTHANNIGHGPLAVWARGMQATSSYWSDAPSDALVAVHRGEEHRPTGVPSARLNSIKARTWSHLGDADQVLQAVRAAQDARAAASGEDDDLAYVGGVFEWDRIREERCASTAFLELTQRRHSELEAAALRYFTGLIIEHAGQALELSRAAPADQRSPIVEATILLDMSTAQLLLGDVAGAHATLRPVFALPADMRTFPVLHRLRGLRAPLAAMPTIRAVHDLRENLAVFAAASTVRALPPGGA
ncbi:hypothetical protein [Planomonospora sp. ID82291]|uniref:hypothetical protein n=1 Tax=Planomonospora sp. ID82291 TaxID=2738136 RepID=UPI0018C3F59C|nr:hypothetical protein [Planomonospora sp. ID82291]MBG0818433.1 hypothetical protein [Planomonospora sp. ID82291]